MENFRKLPGMKKEIARSSDPVKKFNEKVEKIKKDTSIEENIKNLMIENLKYYMGKELGINMGFKK